MSYTNYDRIGVDDIAALSVIKQDKNILIEAIKQLSCRINQDTDFRDVITVLAIIHHTAAKLGEEPDKFLIEHSRGLHPRLERDVESFVSRPPELKTIQVMGYKEVYEPEFRYVFDPNL